MSTQLVEPHYERIENEPSEENKENKTKPLVLRAAPGLQLLRGGLSFFLFILISFDTSQSIALNPAASGTEEGGELPQGTTGSSVIRQLGNPERFGAFRG